MYIYLEDCRYDFMNILERLLLHISDGMEEKLNFSESNRTGSRGTRIYFLLISLIWNRCAFFHFSSIYCWFFRNIIQNIINLIKIEHVLIITSNKTRNYITNVPFYSLFNLFFIQFIDISKINIKSDILLSINFSKI